MGKTTYIMRGFAYVYNTWENPLRLYVGLPMYYIRIFDVRITPRITSDNMHEYHVCPTWDLTWANPRKVYMGLLMYYISVSDRGQWV